MGSRSAQQISRSQRAPPPRAARLRRRRRGTPRGSGSLPSHSATAATGGKVDRTAAQFWPSTGGKQLQRIFHGSQQSAGGALEKKEGDGAAAVEESARASKTMMTARRACGRRASEPTTRLPRLPRRRLRRTEGEPRKKVERPRRRQQQGRREQHRQGR